MACARQGHTGQRVATVRNVKILDLARRRASAQSVNYQFGEKAPRKDDNADNDHRPQIDGSRKTVAQCEYHGITVLEILIYIFFQ